MPVVRTNLTKVRITSQKAKKIINEKRNCAKKVRKTRREKQKQEQAKNIYEKLNCCKNKSKKNLTKSKKEN